MSASTHGRPTTQVVGADPPARRAASDTFIVTFQLLKRIRDMRLSNSFSCERTGKLCALRAGHARSREVGKKKAPRERAPGRFHHLKASARPGEKGAECYYLNIAIGGCRQVVTGSRRSNPSFAGKQHELGSTIK